ncbi:hypothetical protein FUA23_17525 [Neolewinella aurantiaca]|uniref:Bacteriocin-protection protein n=2 Tax=Neolewinella aurantiaca TaxID=2602767 RepID=A0A5C7FKA4_9BACT|nr:hypothetical protein FUA23_17525 [Neolewinella aurantiaca]
MNDNDPDRYTPSSQHDWRNWLEENHVSRDFVWVIFYKVSTGKCTITWSQAVEEALCFGWIDSVKKTLDKERYIQYFSKRKPGSTWSRVNKEAVTKLIQEKRMMEAGAKSIAVAKENGSWTILDQVEALIIPDDLAAAFKTRPGSEAFFLSLSKSKRKVMLSWIVLAKRKDTRDKRIKTIAEHAEQGKRPPNFA